MENYDSMNDISVETALQDLRYLQLLSKQFPTISDACTEIINLEAILNLPKGTEHFLTDIHGEYEAFQHVLKNASGTVRRKVIGKAKKKSYVHSFIIPIISWN